MEDVGDVEVMHHGNLISLAGPKVQVRALLVSHPKIRFPGATSHDPSSSLTLCHCWFLLDLRVEIPAVRHNV